MHEVSGELAAGAYLVGAGREVTSMPFARLLECVRKATNGAVDGS